MKLINAARLADWDSTYCGYTGNYLFKAQFSAYEGADPSGSWQRRRTVSVAPGIVAPHRRVVVVQGVRWIMSTLVSDTYKDRQIRQTASAKEATDLYQILTPGQAALQQPVPLTAYGHLEHLKDTVNSLTDSAYDTQYSASFALTETILSGHFLRSPRNFLHIRSVNLAAEGLWEATADDLTTTNEGLGTDVLATFAGSFDPVTETSAPGATVPVIVVDLYKLYNFNTQADQRNQAGDMSLLVAKSSTTPVAGQDIQINGRKWHNVRFTEYRDAWNVHIRKL